MSKTETAARDDRESRSDRACRRLSSESADGFRQCAYLNIDAAVHGKMIDGAAPLAAEDAGGVRVVHHHDRAIFSAASHRPGSGPMSPSIEKTPSEISSFFPAGS